MGYALHVSKGKESIGCADLRRCSTFTDFQAGAGISVGSSYLAPLTEGTQKQFDDLWQLEVAAEGCGEAGPTQIPILFGRSLEVPLSQHRNFP